MKFKMGLGSVMATLLLSAAGPPAMAQNAAETAVAAAKQYSGITLNLLWPGGLQALDPLIFSGPLFEELTGVKINVVERLDPQFFQLLIEQHRAGTGALDVLRVRRDPRGSLEGNSVLLGLCA